MLKFRWWLSLLDCGSGVKSESNLVSNPAVAERSLHAGGPVAEYGAPGRKVGLELLGRSGSESKYEPDAFG
jgi:hypothetical protein